MIKRRQAAEEALKQQKELLQKEKSLAQEEKNVNDLVSQVRETYQQRKLNHDSSVESSERTPSRVVEKSEGDGGVEELLEQSGPSKEESSSRLIGLSTASALSENISTSPTISEALTNTSQIKTESSTPQDSSIIPTITGPSSEGTRTQIKTELSSGSGSKTPYEDTFESLDTTLTHHPPPPPSPPAAASPPPGGSVAVATSTPTTASAEGRSHPRAPDEYFSLNESLKLTDSMVSGKLDYSHLLPLYLPWLHFVWPH